MCHVCIHERACAHVCACTHCACGGVRGQPRESFLRYRLVCFVRQGLLWPALNKWLSWLAIKARGSTCLSLPSAGAEAHAIMSSFFTWVMEIKLRSSCWQEAKRHPESKARDPATSGRDLPLDHRTETLPLSSKVAGQDVRVCTCPHLS